MKDLPAIKGLAERKVSQLRVLAVIATESWLNTEYLKSIPRSKALVKLQQVSGIGPFSAELIMIRGVGDADHFPLTEKRLQAAMAKTYNLGEDPDINTLQQITKQWPPFRSWAGQLIRNA